MSNWVYERTESGIDYQLYTVGFYNPDGKFCTDSDWFSKEEAAARCNYLNGGNHQSKGD